MKTRSAIFGSFAALGVSALAAQACGSSGLTIAQENSNLGGEIDAGNGLCGTQACAAGQLCCAGSDEYCSPTCMTTGTCPTYGRPCKIQDGGVGTDGGVVDAPAPQLTWYKTCGYPVCGGPLGEDAGPQPVCPAEGSPCTQKGQTCGVPSKDNCGATLVCDDHDPKLGGCPISSAKFKDDIHYLSDGELSALHQETMNMHLASYKYKAAWANGSDATHLGFIVEDQPKSYSVERGFDRVDMYGYLSMIVATMQVQDKEIASLRTELAATHAACGRK